MLRVTTWIAGCLPRRHGDLIGSHVVRVPIEAVIVICNQNLWPLGADERNETADGLVEIGLVERIRMLVLRQAQHSGIAIAQKVKLTYAENRTGGLELASAHFAQIL